ncbi:MAG TPA: LysM peptidoglycan-binding domain-containing protein [Bacillota bacterium]
MLNDSSVFSFELNESLHFERGQEVAEIISISLDPEISIQSFHEYISIRGVIELQGEYLKVDLLDNSEDDFMLSYENEHSKRYIEKVADTADGTATFTHRFPVEISVPTYRVNDLDDIKVRISSFDYELPNESQLQLKSTIKIYGISDLDRQSPEKIDASDGGIEEEQRADTETMEANTQQIEDHFHVEMMKEKQHELDSVEKELSLERADEWSQEEDVSHQDGDDQPHSAEHEQSQKQEESGDEKGRWTKTKTQSFAQFFNKEESEESGHISSEQLESLSEQLFSEEKDVNEPSLTVDASPSISEWMDESSRSADDQQESESSERTKNNSPQIEDAQYLSRMFEESEERYSKMRLCIVQEHDTLESIAERYKTTSLQLIHKNQLADENIVKGQLLYIPPSKKDSQ